MRRASFVSISLAVMLLLPRHVVAQNVAVTSPTSQPVGGMEMDAVKEKATELSKLLMEAAALPEVVVASPMQLIKFDLTKGMLSATTSIRASNQSRITFPGQTGIITFNPLGPIVVRDEPALQFLFIRHDYSLPGAGIALMTVASSEGRINLAVDGEDDQKMWQIEFNQIEPAVDGSDEDKDPVRLRVHWQSKTGEVDVNVSAKSFVELRRKHRDEVNQYLRPIFRELGQEQFASGVDAASAWQVLGTDWKPDELIRAKIGSIVARLGNADFHERESAQRELYRIGQPAAIILGNLDRSALSPEQSAAIDTFLSSFQPLAEADARSMEDNVSFLIDCLTLDDPVLRPLALTRLEKKHGALGFDVEAGAELRAAAANRLREKLVPPPTTQLGSTK